MSQQAPRRLGQDVYFGRVVLAAVVTVFAMVLVWILTYEAARWLSTSVGFSDGLTDVLAAIAAILVGFVIGLTLMAAMFPKLRRR